jgi:hypothetical protein
MSANAASIATSVRRHESATSPAIRPSVPAVGQRLGVDRFHRLPTRRGRLLYASLLKCVRKHAAVAFTLISAITFIGHPGPRFHLHPNR